MGRGTDRSKKVAVMDAGLAGSAGASGAGASHGADDGRHLHFFVRINGLPQKTLAVHARPDETVEELLQTIQ